MNLQVSTTPVPWRLSEIVDHWGGRGGHVISMGWFLVAVAGLVVVVGGTWLWQRHKHHQVRPGPLRIFHRIARAVGLNLADEWLLARIARHQVLPSPLTLLVSSNTLTFHAAQYADSLAPHRRASVERRLSAIARTLFVTTRGDGREKREDGI